jgi:hypothetical protein
MSDWIKKDKAHVWHPFTQMQTAPDPLVITHAKDAVLYTEDGREYIDCNSSWWVNVHGHGNEHIANAIADQVRTLDHVIFAGATHPKAIELAQRVCNILPEKFEKVFFSDDGSSTGIIKELPRKGYLPLMVPTTEIRLERCQWDKEDTLTSLSNLFSLMWISWISLKKATRTN